MEGGDTRLAARLPLSRFRNFIIFPLPRDPEYLDYMRRIRARFPKGALRTVTAGGREFLLGSVTDLRLLFPTVDNDRALLSPPDDNVAEAWRRDPIDSRRAGGEDRRVQYREHAGHASQLNPAPLSGY